LPGCSGVEILTHLKSDARTRHIPVIVLTTTDDPDEIEQCYALGCNAYLTKPVQYDQFVEVIQKLSWLLTEMAVPTGFPSSAAPQGGQGIDDRMAPGSEDDLRHYYQFPAHL
jgi:hypothetical protein